MSTKNRGDKIQLLQKVVTKHFTPVAASEDRNVLENLLYACCLEDAKYDQADEAFHRLRESFFDWNEVRVTTIAELSESLQSLPDPAAAAVRVKQILQGLFESRYSFEIDDMVKMNQGKAVQELEKLSGMTRFVLSYVVQNSLGGHSIPVSKSIMQIFLAADIVSEAEATKWQVPGLERTIPKTKGVDFGSCLHQMAVTVAASPTGKLSKTVLKESGATLKKPAPEKKPKAKPAKKPEEKIEVEKQETKAEAKPAKKAKPTKKAAKKAPAPKAKPKAVAKKAPVKKTAKKAAPKKTVAKTATKKKTKRKPR